MLPELGEQSSEESAEKHEVALSERQRQILEGMDLEDLKNTR